ncbi:MAG: hypothetical protein IJ848_02605 [Alphaproteobacteria bacterium]|nr:hypothetical protein [Alphaproteobacteria bacterium]
MQSGKYTHLWQGNYANDFYDLKLIFNGTVKNISGSAYWYKGGCEEHFDNYNNYEKYNIYDEQYLRDQIAILDNKAGNKENRKLEPFIHKTNQGLCSLDHLTDGWQQ